MLVRREEPFLRNKTGDDAQHRENQQRDRHPGRAIVTVMRSLGARFAEEGNHEKPRHVKRGEDRDTEADDVKRCALFTRCGENGVLRPESRQQREPRERRGADCEGHGCLRHVLGKTAHLPNILLVMQRVNHRTGTEEEQCLEECVREQVEHRRSAVRVGSEANCHDHVAELRERRVGEDALDVILLRGHQRCEQCGDAADPRNDERRVRRESDQKRDTRQHEYAGRDHGRSVDERGNGSRAFHRVGQPGVQRKLRAFSECAAEDEQDGGCEENGVLRKRSDG